MIRGRGGIHCGEECGAGFRAPDIILEGVIRHNGEGEQFLLNKFSIVAAEFVMNFHRNSFTFGCAMIFHTFFQKNDDGLVVDSSLEGDVFLFKIACS
ncbi:hypothetical protein Tco_0905815 [Tanacetum coccineum]